MLLKKPGNVLLSHQIGSTIGAGGLNFRVRHGNGWVPSAMVTRQKTLCLNLSQSSDSFIHRRPPRSSLGAAP